MTKSARIFNLICLLLLLGSAALIWQTNRNTRLYSDDYLYSYKFDPGFVSADPTSISYSKISSLGDYIQSLKGIYNTLTGRIVAHGMLQALLMLPAWLFDLLNTLALFALTALYATWMAGRKHELRLPMWLLATMLFYVAVSGTRSNFYLPAFTCNYIWTQLLVFLFLIPFRSYIQEGASLRKGTWLPMLMLLSGIIAGDTNEPLVPALLLALGVYGLIMLLGKRKALPVWYYAGGMGLFLGFLFMYFAPGNSGRSAYEAEIGGVREIGFSFANILPIALSMFASIPAMILGFWGLLRMNKAAWKQHWLSLLFLFLLFSGTIFALLFTPIYIPRMNILFVSSIMLLCMQMFAVGTPKSLPAYAIVVVLLLPIFAAKLGTDYVWMQRAEGEYQLFRQQLDACDSDSCLVNPRAYLDPLTRANWAKPIATYYGKSYLWIRDEFDPLYMQQWKPASYQVASSSGEKGIKLEGIRYTNHDSYSRTVYVLLNITDSGYKADALHLSLRTADLPKSLQTLALKLPKSLLNYLLPPVQIVRPQNFYISENQAIYALSMPIEDGKEDILRIRIKQNERELKSIFLKNVSFKN